MRQLKFGKYNVEIFDSIDELSSERFQKFNKYLLIDSGVGSDINDFNAHAGRITKLVKSDPEQAIRELENLKMSMYLISEEINPKHLSFVLLIKSINGKPFEDLTDDSIRRTSKKLSEMKVSFLNGLIESVKKKIDQELIDYFPGRFDDVSINEYYDNLREKLLLQLGQLIRSENNESRINKIDEYLLSLSKPAIFYGKDNAEVKYDNQYEEMCVFLTEHLNIQPKKSTVLEFYNALEYLNKQMKKK